MTNQKTQAVIQYTGVHWTIKVRNVGDTKWLPVSDPNKPVRVYDEHGFERARTPSVRTFVTRTEAQAYMTQYLPEVEVVDTMNAPAPTGIRGLISKFMKPAVRPQPDVRE